MIQTKFHQYYQPLLDMLEISYETFSQSLLQKRAPALLVNPKYYNQIKLQWEQQNIPWIPINWFPSAVYWPVNINLGTILPGYYENNIYALNLSSLLPVSLLNAELHGTHLDACAAPGGKTLATYCFNPNQTVIANDASHLRLQKLRNTLNSWQLNFHLFNFKAELIHNKFPQSIDQILADVPCSSESHVLNSPKHFKIWNPNRIKQLTSTQFAILSGLIRALKLGGSLIYSTCAINYHENEMLVNRFLSRYSDYVDLVPIVLPIESSAGLSNNLNLLYDQNLVRRIWPHLHNHDPMFIAKFIKIKEL